MEKVRFGRLYSHFVVDWAVVTALFFVLDLCVYPKIANSRGSFTGFCAAIEEFGHGAASSDDVAVVVGALLGVSAARQDISIKQ